MEALKVKTEVTILRVAGKYPSGIGIVEVSVTEEDTNRQERTEWHRVQIWGKLGEYAATFKKGSHICVEGELRSREYESNGAKVRTYRVVEWKIRQRTHPPLALRNQSPVRAALITMPDHSLPETISLLSRTPAVLNALLRDLPDGWTRRNEGDDTWTAIDVVGHLIHGEKTDWMPRVRLIMEHDDLRTFEPFDMKGHVREIAGKSLSELLDEFARLRAASICDLQALNLQPGDLSRPGLHPALGPVTLSQLLASWPAHDLTHIHQLSRIMANQYREAVGPWSAYMGVMQCGGHGSR